LQSQGSNITNQMAGVAADPRYANGANGVEFGAIEARLGEQLKEITKEISKTKDSLVKYQGETQTGEATHNIEDSSRTTTQQREAAEVQEKTGIEIANNITIGRGATADQAKYIQELASRIVGHTVNLADAVKVLETAAHSPAALVEQVNRAAKALSAFSPGQVAALQQTVDNLEAQVHAMPGQSR